MRKHKFYQTAMEIFNFNSNFLFNVQDFCICSGNTAIYAEETNEYVKIEFECPFEFRTIKKISAIMDVAKHLFTQEKKLFVRFINQSSTHVFGDSSAKKAENSYYKRVINDVFPSNYYTVKKEKVMSLITEDNVQFFAVTPKKIPDFSTECTMLETKETFLAKMKKQFLPIREEGGGRCSMAVGDYRIIFMFLKNGVIRFSVVDALGNMLLVKQAFFSIFSRDFDLLKYLENFNIDEKYELVSTEFFDLLDTLLYTGINTYHGTYDYKHTLNDLPLPGNGSHYKMFETPPHNAASINIFPFISSLIDSSSVEDIREFCQMVIAHKTQSSPAYLNLQIEEIVESKKYPTKLHVPNDSLLFLFSLVNKKGNKKKFYIYMNSFSSGCGIIK